MMDTKEYDVFVSHASEDKETFIRPLVARLAAYGLKVWYDEFTLHVGDSLSRSIDKGLANARFGVVVLSPAFFEKKWPEYELRGLTTREIDGESKILPVWHNVSKKDVSNFSPPLADKLALDSQTNKLEDIVREIIRAVRPDLFRRLNRMLLSLRMLDDASEDFLSIRDQVDKRLPPMKGQERLSDDFRIRIRLIRAVFLDVLDAGSFTDWCNTFAGNEDPQEELVWWENLASAYLEYLAIRKPSADIRSHVFKCTFCVALRMPKERFIQSLAFLPSGDFEVLEKLLGTRTQTVEICETLEDLIALTNG